MTDLTPAELLDLIVEKAANLRRVGVLELGFGGVTLKLAPHEEPAAEVDLEDVEDRSDPMNDPTTFGGRVPGFSRLHEMDDEEPS